MLLHLALVELAGASGPGFVLDKARRKEVWNHPVVAYEFTYLPLKRKDGSLSPAGDLVPVQQVADPFRAYRAHGTTHLVQVQAKVDYAIENGPFVSYRPDDERVEQALYNYTLEFDAQGMLIGGEWGLVPLPGKKAAQEPKNQTFIKGDAPDFLWRYPKDSQPESGILAYPLLKRIQACSTSPETRMYSSPRLELRVPYSECNLD